MPAEKERKKENANGVAYGTGSAKADLHPQGGSRVMVQSRIREGGCGGGAVLGTLEAAAEADNVVRRPNSRNV